MARENPIFGKQRPRNETGTSGHAKFDLKINGIAHAFAPLSGSIAGNIDMSQPTYRSRESALTATMAHGSITLILLRLAIPIIFANLLQTAYQLTDFFWVGRLSAAAVAAVSFSFPISFVFSSVAGGLPIAGAVLLAQHAGRGTKNR
jgi:hypothetical protein